MSDSTITFVGGGNMARSLIGGLLAGGWDPTRVHVADPDAIQLERLNSQFGIHTFNDSIPAVAGSDIVAFAVKPQVLPEVASTLSAPLADQRPLIISVAAGIREPDLRRWLKAELPIVRAMPNTPALVQSAATALFANPFVSEAQRELAESIMRAVGLTVWLDDETLMDAVTALSGSGPAYFLLVMEAMETAGRQMGLPAETTRLLTLQTAFGAAKLALESREDAGTLRKHVTSPGGTTERAVGILQDGGIVDLFERALAGARDRSEELAQALGSRP